MTLGVFKDAILMKCETRGQQLGLVIGMALFFAATLGIAYWMFGIAESARNTLPEFAQRNRYGEYQNGRQRNDLYHTMVMWYALAGLVATVLPVFAAVGVVNLVRLLTNTGLKDNDDW